MKTTVPTIYPYKAKSMCVKNLEPTPMKIISPQTTRKTHLANFEANALSMFYHCPFNCDPYSYLSMSWPRGSVRKITVTAKYEFPLKTALHQIRSDLRNAAAITKRFSFNVQIHNTQPYKLVPKITSPSLWLHPIRSSTRCMAECPACTTYAGCTTNKVRQKYSA
jgi:hypothetical protein